MVWEQAVAPLRAIQSPRPCDTPLSYRGSGVFFWAVELDSLGVCLAFCLAGGGVRGAFRVGSALSCQSRERLLTPAHEPVQGGFLVADLRGIGSVEAAGQGFQRDPELGPFHALDGGGLGGEGLEKSGVMFGANARAGWRTSVFLCKLPNITLSWDPDDDARPGRAVDATLAFWTAASRGRTS